MDLTAKGKSLLRFLKEAATIRRPRMPIYRNEDRVLWFSGIPRDSQEIRSPFLISPNDLSDYWLEVKKTPPPVRTSIPQVLADWVKPEDLDSPHKEPELKKEIMILVEKEIPDPDAPPEAPRTVKETIEEVHRLEDHPEIDDAWVEYYVTHWEPWAEKMRRWWKVYQVYEDVDFMRRRLEESEERFELFLGVGLLQWRDSKDKTIKRHLLTGSAEIVFDASRGLLTVVPAASFETFKPELDMLDLADRPRLEGSAVQEKLEDLDTQAWDNKKVGEILREIANRARGDSQVDEDAFEPARAADGTFRVFFTPALILRERRPSAFEEVMTRLLENSGTSLEDGSEPWKRFLAEGQPLPEDDHVPGDSENGIPVGHEYFPLPSNAEQRQIIQRLQISSGVVVKGPPGTGKSHTIANLICHLLATGEKILVTAQAPKALTVLRDMLPREMRDLCLISLGSSREDQRQLESGVRTIIGRKNLWDQGVPGQADKKIDDHEKDLRLLKEDLSQVERQLRESREAETFPHTILGVYEGTAAQIARRLEEESVRFGWVPETLHDKPPFPFNQSEVQLLTEMHAKLAPSYENELQFITGDFTLPSTEEFRRLANDLKVAEDRAFQAQGKADPRKLNIIQTSSKETLEITCQALRILDEHALRTTRALGNLAEKVLPDLLLGEKLRWTQLSEKASGIIAQIETLLEQVGSADIFISADCDPIQLRADAERRLAYLEQGRWQGFWLIKPKIIKETQYIEVSCKFNGLSAGEPDTLGKLIAYLTVKASTDDFFRLWPDPVGDESNLDNVFRSSVTAKEKASALGRLLEAFENLGEKCFECIPLGERINLAYPSERLLWLAAIEAELAQRVVQEARKPLEDYHEKIRECLDSGKAHPCLRQLLQSLQERRPESWREAFEHRESIRIQQESYQQYQNLMARLEQANASLAFLLRHHQGNSQWQPQLVDLEKAWFWASARGWLEDVTDRQRYEGLVQRYHRLKEKIEKRTEEIASACAWRAFFQRLDKFTIQNLHAWTSAMNRLGAETGRYAYRHRRDARQYLNKCIPKIPAWVMPLHKLWATIEAQPSLFDTVIIDEASQADLSALALLLLAKRIIVVGDKMQNSPEAVGIKEDDIARLIRDYLQDFHFRAEFRPDSSLFDHAERGFGNLISLREHFRCVPEIIRFSNDLCYREAPLVPLRQAPMDRLPPLKHTFVSGGYCEGDGQRIRNEVEADQLVQTLLQGLEDEAYEGKSIGVIVLQGRAQADLIERKLAAALDPRVIADRKLRCGVPATFQGDQRDVVFLSMVASPDTPERRFRALTELDFQRRFNVAMSRAKDQVWLFHSVQQSDLRPDCLRRRLLRFLQSPWQEGRGWEGEELERLEREAVRKPRRPGDQPGPYESWFEVDVALELLRRRYRVRPQYEVAGYRIDLVVEGVESRLAVECDGDAWHGPERYDQDMARQRQLERAEWNFIRIRESEFYLDRSRAVQEIIQACSDLGILPIDVEFTPLHEGEEKLAEPEMPMEERPEDEPSEPEEVAEEAATVAGPFTGYSEEMDFPDPREAPIANICTALKEIIEKDGPLTRSSLYHLYTEGCPHLHRSGRTVRDRLNLALRALLKTGGIVQEDELGSGKPDGLVVRMAGTPTVRLRPAGRRKLEEIPPSEIFLVLDRLQIHTAVSEPDDEELFFRNILEHFGFNQLTRTRRKHLQNLLNRSRQRAKNIQEDHGSETGRPAPGLLFTKGPLFGKE
jgi:very-short-patch-repair endonuclease